MFVNVPDITDAELPEAVPVIPVTVGAVHVYVVPTGTVFPPPSVGVTEKEEPEQIAAV